MGNEGPTPIGTRVRDTATRRDDEHSALEKLRALLPEGATIHFAVKSTSRGNASSVIDFFSFYFEPCGECDGSGMGGACPTCTGRRGAIRTHWLSRYIANAGLGRFDERHDGIRVGGVGHNRAGHVVWALAQRLYGRSDAFTMERL